MQIDIKVPVPVLNTGTTTTQCFIESFVKNLKTVLSEVPKIVEEHTFPDWRIKIDFEVLLLS
jgi:hypothetical protein